MRYTIIIGSAIVTVSAILFLAYMIIPADRESEPVAESVETQIGDAIYLNGFGYAACDQRYVWNGRYYLNIKGDRALVITDRKVTCYLAIDSVLSPYNFGTKTLGSGVFLSHEIPDTFVVAVFSYADCNGDYIWNSSINAYTNTTRQRAVTVGNSIDCYGYTPENGIRGWYGSRKVERR